MAKYLQKSKTRNQKSEIVATYDYHDEHRQLLYQVVRYEPGFQEGERKTFRQRRPDEKGGWITGRGKVPRVLYRLPELLAADPGRLVFVVEGEKDVDKLHDLEIVATTNPEGAGKWQPEFSHALRGRHVVVFPDNDGPGRKHAHKVAESLKGVAGSIKVVELPELPEKGDVSDWLHGNGNDKTALLNLVKDSPQFWPPTVPPSPPGEDAADDGDGSQPPSAAVKSPNARPTQAQVLLTLAEAHEHFQGGNGRAYAAVQVETAEGTHRETLPVRGMAYRQVLGRAYYLATRKAASAGVMQDVLGVLEAKARYEGDTRDVGIRVMQADARVYLDLADKRWRAVEIDAEGWRVVESPPTHFHRPRGMQPLPGPVRGGSLDELRESANIGAGKDWRLSVAWLVQALMPAGPYPVLCVHGEQGAAKSTFCRMLRGILDPNLAPLRSAPRDERDLVIAASNSWVLALDNLSHLDPWMSDALCRLATGGGYATRELFSDSDETILDAQRPILLNGIEELSTRPDLLDRAVVLTLPALDEARRRPEREVWSKYEQAKPRILGALLEAMAGALRNRDQVRLKRLPRMADFAITGAAVGMALGWNDQEFVNVYDANRDEQTETILEGAVIYSVLRTAVPVGTNWEGTATDLLTMLTGQAGARANDKSWPRHGRTLAGMLRRLAPTLRRAGLTVQFDKDGRDRMRRRLIRITASEEPCNPSSPPSPPPPTAPNTGSTGTVGDDGDRGGVDAPPPSSNAGPHPESGGDGGDGGDDGLHGSSIPWQEEHGDAWEGDDLPAAGS